MLSGNFRFRRAPSLPHVEFLQVDDVSFSYPQHIHEAHSIGVMLHGVERMTVNDRTYVAGPGDVLLINADEPHANMSVGATYRIVKVAPELLRDLACEIAGHPLQARPFRTPAASDAGLARAITRLCRLVDEDASDLELESSFLSMVAVLFDGQLRLSALPIGSAQRPVAAARAYLREHQARNVSLAQLSRIANLSAFHLLRTFRKQIGVSPHEYQLQLRIAEARRLLRVDHPIADIAAQTGFCDQSHFSRHFKRIVGMTPGEYASHSKIVQDGTSIVR
jgi:AraC-like DNA-binding protein